MATKKSTACTLKVGQIEKNPILALGVSAKDVSEYERVAKALARASNCYRIIRRYRNNNDNPPVSPGQRQNV